MPGAGDELALLGSGVIVVAKRLRLSSGTKKPASFMPSGAKMWSRMKSGSDWPESFSTM
jgi:hypothetical protein